MQKILTALSMFLLTNVSLANPSEVLGNSIKKTNFDVYFSMVFFILFLIIFITSVICTMKTCKKMKTSDSFEEKNKFTKKSTIYLISSFIFLVLGNTFLAILFTGISFSYVSIHIDLWLIVLSNIIILVAMLELIKRNKIIDNKIINVISVLSIAVVSCLTFVLLF